MVEAYLKEKIEYCRKISRECNSTHKIIVRTLIYNYENDNIDETLFNELKLSGDLNGDMLYYFKSYDTWCVDKLQAIIREIYES